MLDLSEISFCPEKINDLFTGYMAVENWFNRVKSITGITGSQVKFTSLRPTGSLIPCCTVNPSGDAPTEITAPIICAKFEKDFCIRDLQLFMGEGVRITAGAEDPGRIGDKMSEMYVKYFARLLSDIAFNGGTFDGNPFEGFLQIATGALTVTAGNIFDAMYQSYLAMPLEAREAENIGIIVGSEVFPLLQIAMMNRNLYHYNPGTQSGLADMSLPGISGVQIIPVNALNGKNKMLVTPLDNLYWLTNMIGDKDTFAWERSVSQDKWYLRIQTLFGVAIESPEYVVVSTYDPAILTASTAMNVAITSPVNVAGNVVNTATAAVNKASTEVNVADNAGNKATAAVNKASTEVNVADNAGNKATAA